MARVNIDTLAISEINRLEKMNLVQVTIISTTVGKNPLEEIAAIIVNKRVWNAVLECSLKNGRLIYFCFQGKPLNITVTQVYSLTSNAEEAEVKWFYEDIQDHLELGYKKSHPFHYKGLKCRSRKSRDTWSNRQIWPWSTKWSRSKANRVLPREHTSHSKHCLPKTQEMTLHMDITRWSIPKSD